MKVENDLGKDPIQKLVWRIAIPGMLAQFVSVLYSIVDRIYVGNIPEIGDVALAGVGVCGPIITMVGSVAFLIGVGGSPLMSISLGEKNRIQARKILANCFLMLCVFSVLLMAVIFPLKEPMLRLFGASETILPYADEYFTYYMAGTFFALMSTGLNQFIVCQGYAKIGMQAVLLGAILNIILDPIFIFVLDMGVRGAAIATVLSQVISSFFEFRFLLKGEIPVHITFRGYKPAIMRKVLAVGITPFLIIAIDNVMIIVMNAVLQHYGGASRGDMLITCATIVQSFMLVVTMPLGGITGGTQTILGYNYGARQTDRVLQAQKRILLLCIGFTAVMFLLANTMGWLFVRLFTQNEEIAQMTVWAIRVCTLAIVPLGVQYELVDGFTAIGQVKYSLPLSFFRKLVYFLAIFIIPFYFDAQMVFFAQPISDILGPAASVLVYLCVMKRILKRRAADPAVLAEK